MAYQTILDSENLHRSGIVRPQTVLNPEVLPSANKVGGIASKVSYVKPALKVMGKALPYVAATQTAADIATFGYDVNKKKNALGLNNGGSYLANPEEQGYNQSLNRSNEFQQSALPYKPAGAISTIDTAPEKIVSGRGPLQRNPLDMQSTHMPYAKPAIPEEVKGDLAPWDNRVETQDYGRGITEIIGGYNQKGRSFTNLIPAGASKVGIHEMTKRFQEEPQSGLGGIPRWDIGGSIGVGSSGEPMTREESLGAVTGGAIPTDLAGFLAAEQQGGMLRKNHNAILKYKDERGDKQVDQQLKNAQTRGALATATKAEKESDNTLNKQETMKQNKILSLWNQLDKATDPQAKAELAQLIALLQADQTPEYVEGSPAIEPSGQWNPFKENIEKQSEIKGGWRARPALPKN